MANFWKGLRRPVTFIELDLVVQHITEKAILATDGVVSDWIPKMAIENESDIELGVCPNLMVAQWVIKAKGFTP